MDTTGVTGDTREFPNQKRNFMDHTKFPLMGIRDIEKFLVGVVV